MSADAATASSKKALFGKIAWGALIVATLYVCYFSHLGAIGFVGPDEPRYAWIARAMVETGDWVTPRLYGQPWFEKPPLYYWGAALSFKLLGVSEAAARLPSALSALLATLAMAWLAWRVYGAETARWLLLLLPTTVGMIGFSHAAATDMPFSGTLTVAMVCAAVALGLTRTSNKLENSESCHPEGGVRPRNLLLPSFIAKSRFLASLGITFTRSQQTSRNAAADQGTPWLALVLFGFFLGLAVLAKGPAAIVLSGGAVFFWALFTKRWKDAFRLLHPVAIASFCATALPWYILCAHRNPDFFRVFIIEHNFKRFLTPEFHHIQPFWYYGPILLIAVFPWIAILFSAVASAGVATKNGKRGDSAATFLLSWAIFCILFFSISRSKLPGYILPAVPAVGLLLAKHAHLTFSSTRRFNRWLGLATSGILIVSGMVLSELGSRIPVATDIRPAPLVSGIAFLLVGGGIVCGLSAVWRPGTASGLAAVTTVLAIMTLGTGALWQLDGGISPRQTVEVARKLWPNDLATAQVYKLNRSYVYALDFYERRELPEWSPARGNDVLIFSTFKQIEALKRAGVPCPPYIVYPAVIVCGAVTAPASPPAPSHGRQLQ